VSAKICPQCGREYAEFEKFCTEDGATLRSTGGDEGLVNTVVADRYHVTKKLGEGGMGQVYLAEHVRMKRKCALKVMHPAMGQDPDAVQRFSREAANAAQIIHPHVAAVFDFGETPDRLIYLAMEYVEGESLSQIVEGHGALPARRAANIAAQAAEGLAAAHELGIVHRDLKPDNIMIARSRDGSDQVKVVDFGIAKAMSGTGQTQKVTRTGFVIGTPEYMSPEQLVGDPIDGRSDIYSLALVAFNMFTGTLPFPSRTSQEAMIARLTQQPKTLAEMRGDVPWPPRLQEIMDRALARDPNDRYANAKEFAHDLRDCMRQMPNLTVEQLGTQLTEAARAARIAGAGAARATPTMAMAPSAGAFSATAVGSSAAPAPRTPGVPRPPAASAEAPTAPIHRGSLGPKIAIGAGVGLVAVAGIVFAMRGGKETTTVPEAGTSTVVASATSAGATPEGAAIATGIPSPDPVQPTASSTQPTSSGVVDAPPIASVPVSRGTPAREPGPRQASSPAPSRTTAPPAQVQTATRNPQQSVAPPVVPQYSGPVVTAPAVTPRESTPTAPTFDAAAAAGEVRQALQGFAAAFESRRVDEMRKYYPSMPADMISDWNQLFTDKHVTNLTSRLASSSTPDFDGFTAADVTFAIALDFKNGGQKVSQPLRYAARLRKDGSGWRIQNLDPR
jgi:serine/threonine-protein kinase